MTARTSSVQRGHDAKVTCLLSLTRCNACTLRLKRQLQTPLAMLTGRACMEGESFAWPGAICCASSIPSPD